METIFSYNPVPTIRQFALSDAFIRALIGPFGSGKSSGCVVEIVRRAREQRPGPDGIARTRWAVIRNTYGELNDTTIKTFFAWFPPEYYGKYHATERKYVIKAFEKCEIEILFRALDEPDDVRKLLSLDLTGAWVNEAREVPWPVVDALQGRLGRYPAQNQGGPTWYGMVLDTNPPDSDSRFYKFFEEEQWRPSFDAMIRAGVLPPTMIPDDFARIFHQPSGLSPQAENLANLPAGYYQRLGIGKKAEWIKVYIKGDYGFVSDDKAIFPDFNEGVHLRKDVEPVRGVPVYRGWDFGLCYDDQTEVLTREGWKFFKDVDCEKDLIATRNPDNGLMTYARAAFKVCEPYTGEMLEWSSTELNICVTPEHIVPFTFRDSPDKVHWKSADWLARHVGGHHYVDLCSEWYGVALSPLPGVGALYQEGLFAQFMGLYLAEGSVDRNRVTIYQREPRHDMAMILESTGLSWKWQSGEKASGWRVTCGELATYLRQFGKAREKFVPFHIKQSSSATIRAFIAAYTLGDGHVRRRRNGSHEHTIFTTSDRLAGDMQELAQKAGWNSSRRIVRPQVSNYRGRRIANGGGYSITFKKSATRAELLKKNFRRVQYDGMVYCLNVPRHTLYVRRNGKPSWNGNTPACAFSQLLPDGRWLVFDEMVSESMSIDEFGDEVLEKCSRDFKGLVSFEDYGDPAGQERAQTDKRTCFEILQGKGIPIEPGLQTLQIRLESIRKPLRTLVGGEPQFILHPRCKVLRKGFLGGYHFKRLATNAERYANKPNKNEYSHPMDALEYTGTILFGGALTMNRTQQDDYPQAPRSDAGRSRVTGY